VNKPLKILIAGILICGAIILLLDPEFRSNFGNNLPTVNPTKSVSAEGIEKAKIRNVVDGDTATLEDGRKIRFLYIDTPETVKDNTPIMCFGPEASTMTKKLLEGKQVWLRSDKEKTDQYGRDLRMIFLAGENTDQPEKSVNAILVRGGFARARFYKPNNLFEKEFKQYEAEAKSNNLGVWGNCKRPFEQ
jgi:micrococcal nuclease